MIPVLVVTSDKYLHALKAFAYLFNRYWSPDQCVRVIGFSYPDFHLPGNFSFSSLGDMANYPVNRWSDAIIDYLEEHTELHHFVLMLEDYWISRPVNVQAVHMLYDYANQSQDVLKIDLCNDRLYAQGFSDYGSCGYLDLVKSDYNSQYHMSLMTGIWNRELFLRFVIRGESPWDVELKGTPRLAQAKDDVLVLGTRQWPLRHILAYRNNKPNQLILEGLKEEDIIKMRKDNLIQ